MRVTQQAHNSTRGSQITLLPNLLGHVLFRISEKKLRTIVRLMPQLVRPKHHVAILMVQGLNAK